VYGWYCKSLWSIRRTLHSFKRSARLCHRADLRGLRNMSSLTGSKLSGVRAENGPPYGLLSFTDPSWRHLDTHNNRVLRLGASRLWNSRRKPRNVTVTDSVVINNSTAAVWWCTDQRSILTKLQTSLYMMRVSMEAAHSGCAGFQILKTVRCLWHTLYISLYGSTEAFVGLTIPDHDVHPGNI
jgi:hypothetical protein